MDADAPPLGNEMTPTAEPTALNGWNLTPEMLERLPEVMFEITAGDGPLRERIAATRVLLAMDKQNITRATKTGARPPLVQLIHEDLAEPVCEEFEQDEPRSSDPPPEETDIGTRHPTDADRLPTTASWPAESSNPGQASLGSGGDESLPDSARSGDAAEEERAAEELGEAHPEDRARALMATQSRGHSTRRGELSECVSITARGHPIQAPNRFGESSIRCRRG